jgi:hypothetical protein
MAKYDALRNIMGDKRNTEVLNRLVGMGATPRNVMSSQAAGATSMGMESLGQQNAALKAALGISEEGAGGAVAGGGDKLAEFMKGSWGPVLAIMAAQFLGEHLVNKLHGISSTNIEEGALRSRGKSMDPQAMYYEAMMPEISQREEMSRMALMQTIMGGGNGRKQLAEGQEMFGGV